MSLAQPIPASLGHASGVRAHPLLRLHFVALVVACVLVPVQLLGNVPGDVAALLALPLTGAMAFTADRRYLPALLVLCLPSVGLLAGREAQGLASSALRPFVFPGASTFVSIGGVEVSTILVLLAAAFARVGMEVLMGGRPFRGVVPGWLILLFFLAVGLALASGLEGQAAGYNRWSQGPRAMLALGGFFWGIVVARRAGPAAVTRLGGQLTWLILVGAVLLVTGIMSSYLVLVTVGFAGGLIPYFAGRRNLLAAGACAGAAVMAAVMMTLTTAGQVVLALACVAVSAPGARAAGRWLLRAGITTACVLSVGLIWVVMQLQGKSLVEVATRDEGLMAYAVFKLMGDRGPLWLAAVDQITTGSPLVVPAGRPLRPESFDYGGLVYLWEQGAHNAVLELLRNVGLVAGLVGLVLIGFSIVAAARLLVETRSTAWRGVAAGFLGVAIVGVTTGNFPVYDVGFFIWAIGGILAGARLYAPPREAPAGETA